MNLDDLLSLAPVALFVALAARKPLQALLRRWRKKRRETTEFRRDYEPIEPR